MSIYFKIILQVLGPQMGFVPTKKNSLRGPVWRCYIFHLMLIAVAYPTLNLKSFSCHGKSQQKNLTKLSTKMFL